jgi:hypothetical protein
MPSRSKRETRKLGMICNNPCEPLPRNLLRPFLANEGIERPSSRKIRVANSQKA